MQLYEHHGFQGEIAYEFLYPDNEWPKRRVVSDDACGPKSKMRAMAEETMRATRLNTSTLFPHNGSMKKHIDPFLDHLPV